MGYKSERFNEEPHNAFTVLRARFDKWFADQAVGAGAVLVNETVAEDVLRENGQIVGVRTNREDGDIRANVVIACDGVNSLLSQKAGLHGEWKPNQVAIGVKEVIQMGREKLEDRFGLENGEGTAIELFGDATCGMMGYGFIYTNRDTLSVGVGVLLSDLIERKINPNQLQERFKQHPMVRKLLEGGEAKEYMAHLIPEGGWASVPPVHTGGFLVAGDAAMMVNGIFREGSNLAAISGKLAAQTALDALERGDFSSRTMAGYMDRLEDSFIVRDLQGYSRISKYAHQHPDLFTVYPQLMADAVHQLMTVDSTPKYLKLLDIMRGVRGRRPLLSMAKDFAGALRSLP